MSGLWKNPVSHGEILKMVWKHLDLGVLQAKHPFHTAVFGTVCDGMPEMRVVVLRRFWRKPPRLAFHAHAGSPKTKQILSNPSCAWVFYHPEDRVQVKIRGKAVIHRDDELADEQWEATSLFARRCYMGKPPGVESKKPDHGLPKEIVDAEPEAEATAEARPNFVVISTDIETVDVMELDVKGHRRSLFDWRKGELATNWLTP